MHFNTVKQTRGYNHRNIGFKKIQFLMWTCVLSHAEANCQLQTACAKLQQVPKCTVCQCINLPSSSWSQTHVVKNRASAASKESLLPGQETSVGHFVCSNKGCLFEGHGKMFEDDTCDDGCIVVDHASHHILVAFQAPPDTHKTLCAKEQCKLVCCDHGIIPHAFWSDDRKPPSEKSNKQEGRGSIDFLLLTRIVNRITCIVGRQTHTIVRQTTHNKI